MLVLTNMLAATVGGGQGLQGLQENRISGASKAHCIAICERQGTAAMPTRNVHCCAC